MHIIGHSDIQMMLNKSVENDKVMHAYLFYGKAGIGKKLVATEFAKAMMCLDCKAGVACGKCESCMLFESGSDFSLITPEKNVIKVDVIRELISNIYLKPIHSKRKCILIDDAECMNESAQNALLKVLEEPPSYATIILISDNKKKILNTILSRVVEVDFNMLSSDEMVEILGNDFDKDIISYSGGSVQRALKLKEDSFIGVASEFVSILETKDFLLANRKLEEIKQDKDLKAGISDIFEIMQIICQKRLKDNLLFYGKLIEVLDKTNQNIQKNANFDLALDDMILQICY